MNLNKYLINLSTLKLLSEQINSIPKIFLYLIHIQKLTIFIYRVKIQVKYYTIPIFLNLFIYIDILLKKILFHLLFILQIFKSIIYFHFIQFFIVIIK